VEAHLMATDVIALNQPVLRWAARARTIPDIEKELSRIWARQDLTTEVEGQTGRHISARTNVMNLVVIARRPEIAERGAATIQALTGLHPSRTIVVQPADPDGPSWLDARIEAHCVLPAADAPETCAETIHLIAGGESGRHLVALVTPLIIHDLPVTIWWPGEPPFATKATNELFSACDRLVVDGSTWGGDGLARLAEMATCAETTGIAVSDFAMMRQSRWREAIASIFDDPDYLPYLRYVRRISVTYGTHDDAGSPGSTNIVKPVYHVAWLASRLGMHVVKPLAEATGPGKAAKPKPGSASPMHRGMTASLADGRSEVAVVIRPIHSDMPSGTTLRVELLCDRRGSELRADVTAEAETVHVRVWIDGVEALDRHFLAARRGDVDLLAESIEAVDRDRVSYGTLQMAAKLTGAHPHGHRST
jgi:glucose-6-phosphate dehydrogenase assembly protein OpcA